MQGLTDYEPPKEIISFKSGGKTFSFTVRGISLDDITKIISVHLEDIASIKALYDRSGADIYTQKNMDKFVIAMITSAPGLAYEIISHASGEAVDRISVLPLPVHITSLADILRLTLEDVGGLRPLKASLEQLLPQLIPAETLGAMKGALQKFKSSTGASVKTPVS